MLERCPATAESAAHFFLRNIERPQLYRSSRVLDPKFWRNGGEASSCASWWPQYLREIRQIPYALRSVTNDYTVTSKSSASVRHKRERANRRESHSSRLYTVSATNNEKENLSRMNAIRQRRQAMLQRLRAIREGTASPDDTPTQAEDSVANVVTETRKQVAEVRTDLELAPAISSHAKSLDRLDESEFKLGEQPDESQTQDKMDGLDSSDHLTMYEQPIFTSANNAPKLEGYARKFPVGNFTSPFLGIYETPDEVEISESDEAGLQEAVVAQETNNAEGASHSDALHDSHEPTVQEADINQVIANLDEASQVETSSQLDEVPEIEYTDFLGLTARMRDDTHDEPFPERSKVILYERKLQELRRLHHERRRLNDRHFQNAWGLFLSFENQQDVATLVFEIFSFSGSEKQLVRAREAFRLIPEDERDLESYRAVVEVEVKRDQFEAAIRLAIQAHTRGYNLLPELLARFVSGLHWSAAAELLHCNRSAYNNRASSDERLPTSVAPLVSESDILARCEAMVGLEVKLIDLIERLDQNDATLYEHRDLLVNLRKSLTETCVTSSAVMGSISSTNLLALFDHQKKTFGDHSLHDKALRTIHKLDNASARVELALMSYRNRRFSLPRRRVTRALLGILISLCNQANYPLAVYEFIAEELRTHCGGVDQRAYQRFATACAHYGNAFATERVIAECERDHGAANIETLSPLIYAHAVNGDVDGACMALTNLKRVYGLIPNTHCYNMALLALARDHRPSRSNASSILAQMDCDQVARDAYTYGTLLSIYQKCGDIKGALRTLKAAREQGLQISMPMLTTVVEMYLAMNDPQAALRFAQASAQSVSAGSCTRLWNALIRHFMSKGELEQVAKVRAIMGDLRVKPDALTYAPIVLHLTLRNQTVRAIQLVQEMQDQHKLLITPFLYSLLLCGALREHNSDLVQTIFAEFQQQYGVLPPSAKLAMFELAFQREAPGGNVDGISTSYLTSLLEDLYSNEQSVSAFDSLSVKPLQGEQIAAKYFAAAIRMLNRYGSAAGSYSLLKHFEEKRSPGRRDISTSLPREYHIARMDAATQINRVDEVEDIFLTLYRSRGGPEGDLNSSTDVEDVGPLRKRIRMTTVGSINLSKPLNRLMEAQARAGRQKQMCRFIHHSYELSGFQLTSHNYNKYVQVLCRSDDARLRLQALTMAEKVLLNRAQSWNLLRRGRLRRKIVKWVYERQNYRSVRPVLHKKTTYFTTDRNETMRMAPLRHIPTYTTMVYLAGVLKHAVDKARLGDTVELDQIRQHAGKLKHFLEQMPYLKDSKQGTMIRGWSHSNEMRPRPRSEASLRATGSVDTVRGHVPTISELAPREIGMVKHLADRSDVSALLPKSRAGTEPVERLNEKLWVAEQITGQIPRSKIVLAKQGRFETETEMRARIQREEQEKLDRVNTLLQQFRRREFPPSSKQHLVSAVGVPTDVALELPGSLNLHPSIALLPLPGNIIADSEPMVSSVATKSGVSRAKISDNLAEENSLETDDLLSLQRCRITCTVADDGTKQYFQVYERGPRRQTMITSNLSVTEQIRLLQERRGQRARGGFIKRRRALDYVWLRIVRARRAFQQRAEVDASLEQPIAQGLIRETSIEPRTTAMRRMLRSTISKRRRAAWLEFEADLRSGNLASSKRPFFESRYRMFRRVYGQTPLRFVPNLQRLRNYYRLIKLGILEDRRRPKLMSKFDQRKFMQQQREGYLAYLVIEENRGEKARVRKSVVDAPHKPVKVRIQQLAVNRKIRGKIKVKQALARQAAARKQRIINLVGVEEYERRIEARRRPSFVPYR